MKKNTSSLLGGDRLDQIVQKAIDIRNNPGTIDDQILRAESNKIALLKNYDTLKNAGLDEAAKNAQNDINVLNNILQSLKSQTGTQTQAGTQTQTETKMPWKIIGISVGALAVLVIIVLAVKT